MNSLQPEQKSIAANIKSVLLIRSAQPEACNQAIEIIGKLYPEAEFDLLCQNNTPAGIRKSSFFKNIEVVNIGPLSRSVVGLIRMQRLRTRRYDIVVIVFSDVDGNGYDNVKRLANQIKPKGLISINSEGKIAEIQPGKVEFKITKLKLVEAFMIISCGSLFLFVYSFTWILSFFFPKKIQTFTEPR
jgi:hypothetical protein